MVYIAPLFGISPSTDIKYQFTNLIPICVFVAVENGKGWSSKNE